MAVFPSSMRGCRPIRRLENHGTMDGLEDPFKVHARGMAVYLAT